MESKIVYIDGTDFQYELGEADGGVRTYPSVENALQENPCTDSCGLVKCEVSFLEWVIPQDWSKAKKVPATQGEIENNYELQVLEGMKRNLEYLEERISKLKARIAQVEENLSRASK